MDERRPEEWYAEVCRVSGEKPVYRYGRPVITAEMAACIECPFPPYEPNNEDANG